MFFDDIAAELRRDIVDVRPEFAFVPGNHDFDFSKDSVDV